MMVARRASINSIATSSAGECTQARFLSRLIHLPQHIGRTLLLHSLRLRRGAPCTVWIKTVAYNDCVDPHFITLGEIICTKLYTDVPSSATCPFLSRLRGLRETLYEKLAPAGFPTEDVNREVANGRDYRRATLLSSRN